MKWILFEASTENNLWTIFLPLQLLWGKQYEESAREECAESWEACSVQLEQQWRVDLNSVLASLGYRIGWPEFRAEGNL